jgi:hypothetical protein
VRGSSRMGRREGGPDDTDRQCADERRRPGGDHASPQPSPAASFILLLLPPPPSPPFLHDRHPPVIIEFANRAEVCPRHRRQSVRALILINRHGNN